MLITEDIIRQTTAMMLQLYPTNNTIAGVGQLTSFKQLGQTLNSDNPVWKNEANRPDGWVLPRNSNKSALVFEFKNSQQDLSNSDIQNELKTNMTIANTVYNTVIGVLYNGFQSRIYIKTYGNTIKERKDLRDHCLMSTSHYLKLKYNKQQTTQLEKPKLIQTKPHKDNKKELTDIKLAQILSKEIEPIKYNIHTKTWYDDNTKYALEDQKTPIDKQYIQTLTNIKTNFDNTKKYESQTKMKAIMKLIKSTAFIGESSTGFNIVPITEIHIKNKVLNAVKCKKLCPDPKASILRGDLAKIILCQKDIKISRTALYKILNKYLPQRKTRRGNEYVGLYEIQSNTTPSHPYSKLKSEYNEAAYDKYIQEHELAKKFMKELNSIK